MGRASTPVMASGHPPLDAVLPDGGWPRQSLTEILQAQPGLGEWRLLGPALARLIELGGSVLLIGPPLVPYLPALAQAGLLPERLIRIEARTPSERLWATEQSLKADCLSAVLSWLPQARPEQIRRLHACAAHHRGLLFTFRPHRVRQESSAAPLRLQLDVGPCPHPLTIQVLKRKGPLLETPIVLETWARGLAPLWTPPTRPAPARPQRDPRPIRAPDSLVSHADLDRLAARPLL